MLLIVVNDGIIDRVLVRESDDNQSWIGDFRIGRNPVGIANEIVVNDIVSNLSPTEADLGNGTYRIGFENQCKILKLMLAQERLQRLDDVWANCCLDGRLSDGMARR